MASQPPPSGSGAEQQNGGAGDGGEVQRNRSRDEPSGSSPSSAATAAGTSDEKGSEPGNGKPAAAQGAGPKGCPPKEPEKKPSKIKQLWNKAGLDVMTLSMMLKGSIPPTVALAMYQSDAVAKQYSTLGYVVSLQDARQSRLRLTTTGISLPSPPFSASALCRAASSFRP